MPKCKAKESPPLNDVQLYTQKIFHLTETEFEEEIIPLALVPKLIPCTMFADYPNLMTRDQAVEALSTNPRDMSNWLDSGDISAFHDGRRWVIPKTSLVEFVERRLEEAKQD